MRTTLVIPDAIYNRAKEAARTEGKTLSGYVAESIEMHLARTQVAEKRGTFKVRPISMGKPKADITDREALSRTMEE